MLRKFISPWAYPLEVHLAEQFAYGHREVLFASNRINCDSVLKAKLQHGWMDVVSKNGLEKTRWTTNVTSLVWSQRIASDLGKLGVNNSIVIGAPWVHLLHALKFDPKNLHKNQITQKNALFFPGHSHVGVLSLPNQNISELKEILGVSRISISLFWKDFINPKIREFYSQDFSNLLCHGFRGSSGFELPWSDEGGRTMFLPNLLRALMTHDTVVASPWSTAFWYALSLRKQIYIPDAPDQAIYYGFDRTANISTVLRTYLEKIPLDLPIGQVFLPNSEHVSYALDELGWNESIEIMHSRSILKLLRKTTISTEIGSQISAFIHKNIGKFDDLEL